MQELLAVIAFIALSVYLVICYFQGIKMLQALSEVNSRSISGGWQAARTVLDSFHYFDVTLEKAASEREETTYRVRQKALRIAWEDYDECSMASVSRVLYVLSEVLRHMEGQALVYIESLLDKSLQWIQAFSMGLSLISLVMGARMVFWVAGTLFLVSVLLNRFLLRRHRISCHRMFEHLCQKKLFPERELELLRNGFESVRMRRMAAFLRPFRVVFQDQKRGSAR